MSIVEFKVNNYQSSFTELTLFFAIKDYYFQSDLKLFKSISTDTIIYNKTNIKDADSYIVKLEALKKYLQIKLL